MADVTPGDVVYYGCCIICVLHHWFFPRGYTRITLDASYTLKNYTHCNTRHVMLRTIIIYRLFDIVLLLHHIWKCRFPERYFPVVSNYGATLPDRAMPLCLIMVTYPHIACRWICFVRVIIPNHVRERYARGSQRYT